MGEIVEMIMEGTLCEQCGVVLDDIVNGADAPGYPRLCWDCASEERVCPNCRNSKIKVNHKFCTICGLKIEEDFFNGN